MNNNDIILKADNLYFSYDDEKTHSLNGLSPGFQRVENLLHFMGANGSGKSTFSSAIPEFTNQVRELFLL